MQKMMKDNLSPYGNSQNGKIMSIEDNPKQILKSSLEVLRKSYKVAKKKDDTETMLAISDRLMVLYELLNNVKATSKSKPMGFLMGDDDE